MDICVFDMPSYTFARKAERLLRSRGYRCTLNRRSDIAGSGCGWELSTESGRPSGCRNAAAVLDRYDIPYRLHSGRASQAGDGT